MFTMRIEGLQNIATIQQFNQIILRKHSCIAFELL